MNSEQGSNRVDLAKLNSTALHLLNDAHLEKLVRDRSSVSIKKLRSSVDQAMCASHLIPKLPPVDSIALHQQLVKGLPSASTFIAIAMAFDTVHEGLTFFGLSKNSSYRRLGKQLNSVAGEKALRIASVVLLAAHILKSADEARAYLKMPNFALGGAAPRDLLMTAIGAELVLNELQTQAGCGPI